MQYFDILEQSVSLNHVVEKGALCLLTAQQNPAMLQLITSA